MGLAVAEFDPGGLGGSVVAAQRYNQRLRRPRGQRNGESLTGAALEGRGARARSGGVIGIAIKRAGGRRRRRVLARGPRVSPRMPDAAARRTYAG
jgi:hypothetical protein